MEQAYFPMFVDLTEKKILVVGGGKIGLRRIKTLLKFSKKISVVTKTACPELKKLAEEGYIELKEKQYEEKDIGTAELVLAATDSKEVNHSIYKACKKQNIIVNVADDQTLCDFYFPAVVTTEEMVVGISSGGKDPVKSGQLRGKIEEIVKKV